MENKPLFQKKALDKMRKPMQLDQLFTITSSLGWLLIAAVMLVLFSGIIWSVFGVMADKVNGYGIIVDSAGVSSIAHTSAGRVQKMVVKIGETVKKGQIVAYIEQPQLEQNALLSKERLALGKTSTDMRDRVAQYSSTKDELQREVQVVSPFDGIIVEQRVKEGDLVSTGTTFYVLRQMSAREDIMAVVYVPVLEGKKVKEGMTIQISPGSVDSSQHGAMVGRVVSVSEYPVSSDSIMVWVARNKDLVSWIAGKSGGSMLEVNVELIKDNATPSGYLWTSVVGPDEKITTGTACTAKVIVHRDAPIVKAYRKFSQWVRSD
ncbi:efflux RND transporter periplasmic adaptor subunit [Sporomusa sp. KB1]|jgi:biotin carboxyl carrier protein|uniref:efflux RND transporter periplasmic adaptor subunit n=1 Tax=Sporomusa sp. KB1 TaxID=943346 RepID=UPI0011ADC5B3|nr:efflux RND transporter periplasmic adaptor subunit [Sporomusa sp. KB1]TWH46391.1 NHLM bacteriocin system secretion protein [Sporomusa sp. KB1]